MDLNSHYQQLQQNQPNSRLLRFRSSFKQGEGCATNSGETSSSTFREFMDHNPSNHKGDNNESSLSQRHMNSQQGYRMDQHKGFYTNLLRQSSSSHAGHFSNNNIISFGNGIVVLFLFLIFVLFLTFLFNDLISSRQLFMLVQCFFWGLSLQFLKIEFEILINILCARNRVQYFVNIVVGLGAKVQSNTRYNFSPSRETFTFSVISLLEIGKTCC